MTSGDTIEPQAPMLSIVVAAESASAAPRLVATLASIVAQTSQDWQLVVGVGARAGADVDTALSRQGLDAGGARSTQVRTVPFHGSRSEGWSEACSVVTGQYVMILDPGVALSANAVATVGAELARWPNGEPGQSERGTVTPDLIYGDEDVLSVDGTRTDAFYKPAFSPDRLRVQDYLGEAVMYRTELVRQVGGLRPVHEHQARYDLTLRIAEQSECIVHIPAILVHVPLSDRVRQPDGSVAAVVQEHLDRTRFQSVVEEEVQIADGVGGRQSIVARLSPRLTRHPKASVIIPTGGSSRVIRGRRQRMIDLALKSLASTRYPNFEIVVVFDRSSGEELKTSVRHALAGQPHHLVQDDRPFNYSQACNLGVARSTGDILVFLNDDTEIVRGDWLERMVMFAMAPQIGAVGVKLLYEDGRLQHTGVWARNGHVAHRYSGFAPDHTGVRGSLAVQLNCSAVTAACMAVERIKFEDVGGFCTDLPLAFNDVDLCFKLQMAGYRSVVDNDNVVVHLESSSRNPSTHQWELDHVHHRWRPVMYFDPYDNPNNTGRDCDEYPPTPPGLADARWEDGAFQRAGRTWRRAPIEVDEAGVLGGVAAELVEVASPGRPVVDHR